MTQTRTETTGGIPLLLVPIIGGLSGAAHTAAWHYIPIPTVTLAVTFGAWLILWITVSVATGSKGAGIVMALLTGLCTLAATWALWFVLEFGLDGVQTIYNSGRLPGLVYQVELYLEGFRATVSRRSQSMTFDGGEIRVIWMILAGIWVLLPLAAAAFRKR